MLSVRASVKPVRSPSVYTSRRVHKQSARRLEYMPTSPRSCRRRCRPVMGEFLSLSENSDISHRSWKGIKSVQNIRRNMIWALADTGGPILKSKKYNKGAEGYQVIMCEVVYVSRGSCRSRRCPKTHESEATPRHVVAHNQTRDGGLRVTAAGSLLLPTGPT